MRVYTDCQKTELARVVCNCCRRELSLQNGILQEECIHVEHAFGFFGKKDGENQAFDLCEACYEKWIAQFPIPVETLERKELL